MSNPQLDTSKAFLKLLSEGSAVSGYELCLTQHITSGFSKWVDEIMADHFGNHYLRKTGTLGQKKIMLAAHADEIGLMIKEIDPRGFLRFTQIQGVDPKTLLGQEVVIHGHRDVPGIIGSMPPHLLKASDIHKVIKIEDMGIDVGMPSEMIREVIRVGDTVTIRRNMVSLLNSLVAGKAFDDRAGIVVMAVCLEELTRIRHAHDVYAVVTSQEEVGMRGAGISAYTLQPDLAIAIDVTHAATPDTKASINIELGKGPAIGLGPNFHPMIYHHLKETAILNRIPCQTDPIPGIPGTDAWMIQVSRSGIPTGLIEIPLRYMHSSVETLDMQDVVHAGKLLAYFISSLPDDLEDFLCC